MKIESSLHKLYAAYNMDNLSYPKSCLIKYYLSVIGQPATGLLVKVLKMRHKNELSGGHWTFMRKM